MTTDSSMLTMQTQTYNPLKYWSAPNQSTPDYVTCYNFRDFVAYGLLECWLSHDPNDPNADCNMARPVDREDVKELRGYFLDVLETAIAALWKEQYKPGDGSIDGDWETLIVGNSDENPGEEETFLAWYVRLDDDAIMLELSCSGADSTAIWLSYEAIEDRQNVLKVLTEARKTIDDVVWKDLQDLVSTEG